MDPEAWICTQRVPNFRETENVQPSEAKARRTLPSARAWLWIAPDPVSEQQTERAASFLRFRAFRPTAAPWLLLSVYVWWGGNPSPVINSYNPDSSSHPTHITERHAVGRLRVGAKRHACVSRREPPQRAGGPGAWSRGKVTRRGRDATRPMEEHIQR